MDFTRVTRPLLLVAPLFLGAALATGAEQPAGSSDAAKAAFASAAALQNRKAWDLAAEEWEALVKNHPGDPLAAKARYYLGLCLAQAGQKEKALETFRQVAAGKADAETLALARWEVGLAEFQAAQAQPAPAAFAAAARSLAEFLEKNPGQPQAADAIFFLGESLWQSGKRDAALAAWQRFAREHGQSSRLPEVLYALGTGQAEAGKKDEAAATLRRFAESFPQHALAVDVALWRADLAMAKGDSASVEAILTPIADGKGPRAADALDRLATARWNRKDWPTAAAAFSALADRYPERPSVAQAMLSAGMAYAEAGKPDDARRWLSRAAAAAGPQAADAAHRLARLELAAKKPTAALAVADEALARLASGKPDSGTPDSGKPDAAAEATRLRAALELDRADSLWEIPDRRADASAAYLKVATDHPDQPAAKTAGSMAVLALFEAGKPAASLAEADRFLKRHAGADKGDATTADVRAIRAEAMLAQGQAAAAAAAYAELLAAAAGPPPAPPARVARWRLRQGAALVAAKQWQQAHAALAAAAAGLKDAAAAEALLLDATALVELKQPAEAVKTLLSLDTAHPKWPRRDEALLLLVRARREAGDKPGALAAAERLVAEFPATKTADVAWYRLGQARQDAGRHDEAIQAFGRSREIKPKGPRAPWCLLASGWCHEAKGRPDDALKSWTRLLDDYHDSTAAVPALLARADARQRRGDFTGGLADARAVLARQAEGKAVDADAVPEALLVEGLCLSGAKQHAEAAAAFRTLLDGHPGFPAADRALFEMAAAQALAGRGAEAAETFASLVKRFPRSAYAADAWFEIGERAWTAGRHDEAATAYRAVIERAAESKGTGANAAGQAALAEQALHKLAWTFVARGDHAAAAKAFGDQLSRFPRGTLAADAQAMRGESLFKDAHPEEAQAAFEAALADPRQLSSDEIRGLAFVRAAECAAAREKWAESLAFADRLVAAEPSSPRAPQARYAAAWARQNLGRLDEALAGYRALADADRTETGARARLMEGEVLFELERHKEAVKAFFKVAYGFGEKAAPPAFHPWQAQATFEAARCFEVLGSSEQARGLYAELVERYPDSQHVPAAKKRLASLGGAAGPSRTPQD